MSTELTIVPRGELERARRVIRSNLINAVAAFVVGGFVVAAGVMLRPIGMYTVITIGGGGVLGVRGVVHVVRALRARATVRGKLGDQELPAARLLGPGGR